MKVGLCCQLLLLTASSSVLLTAPKGIFLSSIREPFWGSKVAKKKKNLYFSLICSAANEDKNLQWLFVVATQVRVICWSLENVQKTFHAFKNTFSVSVSLSFLFSFFFS